MMDLMLEDNLELSDRLAKAESKLSVVRNKLREAERQLERLG